MSASQGMFARIAFSPDGQRLASVSALYLVDKTTSHRLVSYGFGLWARVPSWGKAASIKLCLGHGLGSSGSVRGDRELRWYHPSMG